jgi:rubrerythrin
LVEQPTVVALLRTIPDEDLLAILQAVFEVKRPNPEEDAYNQNCYFLGTASRLLASLEGESEHWKPWKIEAVAYIDHEAYPNTSSGNNGPYYGFCEGGACQNCGMAMRSNVKHGICPICGNKVYMT